MTTRQLGNMKITNDLTNLTTAILILTVQMFFEWTLQLKQIFRSKFRFYYSNVQRRVGLPIYFFLPKIYFILTNRLLLVLAKLKSFLLSITKLYCVILSKKLS
jgi:hypothetical protein